MIDWNGIRHREGHEFYTCSGKLDTEASARYWISMHPAKGTDAGPRTTMVPICDPPVGISHNIVVHVAADTEGDRTINRIAALPKVADRLVLLPSEPTYGEE